MSPSDLVLVQADGASPLLRNKAAWLSEHAPHLKEDLGVSEKAHREPTRDYRALPS